MFLIPLLRVYIKQHSSNAYSIQFRVQYSTVQLQLAQQCIEISTRINSSMYIVHTSFVSLETTFYLRVILQGFVDPIMQQHIHAVDTFGKRSGKITINILTLGYFSMDIRLDKDMP